MYAQINGLNFFYEDRAAGETQPILFLHNSLTNHSIWHHQLEYFGMTHRCIAPDLRGHGGTTALGERLPPEQTTIDLFADDVIALLDHLHVKKTVVCGLSMGGYIALALWRKQPGRISRMVLVDTRATADKPDAKTERYWRIEQVKAHGTAGLTDAILRTALAPEHLRTTLALEVRHMIAATRPEDVIATLHALAERPDASQLLVNVTAPTLIVNGERDDLNSTREANALYFEAERAWQLAVIPRAGHLSPLENPAAFNQALAEFLAA
jgi:3-oxoadipate enol-lactonase